MTPRKNIGLFLGILILAVLSQACYCRLIQLKQVNAAVEKTTISSAHAGGIPLHQPRSTGSSLRNISEEEDEDETSKEMLQATTFHLSAFLNQIYSRQRAIFQELFIDLVTPPPRN